MRMREEAPHEKKRPDSLSLSVPSFQIYMAVREWRGLPPAADEAVEKLKVEARRQAREDKARAALVSLVLGCFCSVCLFSSQFKCSLCSQTDSRHELQCIDSLLTHSHTQTHTSQEEKRQRMLEREEAEQARRDAAAAGGASTSDRRPAAAAAAAAGKAAKGEVDEEEEDEIELLEERNLDAALAVSFRVGGKAAVCAVA